VQGDSSDPNAKRAPQKIQLRSKKEFSFQQNKIGVSIFDEAPGKDFVIDNAFTGEQR